MRGKGCLLSSAAPVARQSGISAGWDLSQGFHTDTAWGIWGILDPTHPSLPGTPLPWDTSPMRLLCWYNLMPHPVPEPKDETGCPTGTTEEPTRYLLAEGRRDNVLEASVSNHFGSISYLSPRYFSGTSISPTTSARYHCTGTKLEGSSELEQKDWLIPQRRML